MKEAKIIEMIRQILLLRHDKKDPPRIVPVSVPAVLADNVFFLINTKISKFGEITKEPAPEKQCSIFCDNSYNKTTTRNSNLML